MPHLIRTGQTAASLARDGVGDGQRVAAQHCARRREVSGREQRAGRAANGAAGRDEATSNGVSGVDVEYRRRCRVRGGTGSRGCGSEGRARGVRVASDLRPTSMGSHRVASSDGAGALQTHIERSGIGRTKEILVQQIVLARGHNQIGEAIYPAEVALSIAAFDNELAGHANEVIDFMAGNKASASSVSQNNQILVVHLAIPYWCPCCSCSRDWCPYRTSTHIYWYPAITRRGIG